MDLAGIALQGCDTDCCGDIDAVVLAAATMGEFPDPRGRGRRIIEDHLASCH